MSDTPGTIRNDVTGQPYMTETPADGFAHLVFQEFDKDNIGNQYDTLYTTDERHMVNGINQLYQTTLSWVELEQAPHEFFNADIANPLTRLKFSKVGKHYIAEVVEDSDLDLEAAKPASDIGEMAAIGDFIQLPEKDVVYYAQGDDIEILKRFMNTNYTVDAVSFNPSRDVDYTLMALGNNDFLTPVVIRNYRNNGGYSTIMFKNEVKDAIDLNIDTYTKDRALKALSVDAGINLNRDNFTGVDQVRAFEPMTGLDKTYTLYELKKGDKTRYMAAVKANTLPSDDILLEGGDFADSAE